MPFSPLELLDEDYSELFPATAEKKNEKINRREAKNHQHEDNVPQKSEAPKIQLESPHTDWERNSTERIMENIYTHKNESKTCENNQITDDEHLNAECSGTENNGKKLSEENRKLNSNTQGKLFHQTNETSVAPTSMNSVKDSSLTCIEITERENDNARPSDEIEPVIKPTIRTRRHILSSNIKSSPRLSSIKRSNSLYHLANSKVSNKSTHQLYSKNNDCPLNAVVLRDLAYQSWRNRLVKSARIERMSNLRNEIDETKKEKEKLERMKSNEICFQAWKQSKHQLLIDTIKKRKAEELAQKKKLEEEQERKLNSEKAFNVWKAHKDESIIKQHRDYLSRQKREKESKETEQNEKQYLSQQAFEDWKAKKDAALKQSIQSKRKHQTEKEKQLEEAYRIKMEQAAEAYHQWELKKVASLENLVISIDHSNKTNRRPWRPPSKTISPNYAHRMY
ncbi:putative microtubule-associated protein 9 (Aster-associated protein) [Schistosoma mansoni]|uniref:putative microtubule-associated protein 9 (Aster-associated protein) n=1 Tax=Schistosoma mansoni TaxID=6183 RepID=UPI0001A64242|nr:putative microtubule-associated protein 9 (Aster-associated protein) [Schistosoma mansoni]|eukprot:XP_018652458.1 putative microtubule-associated protein 9 (Aster-associated protein) [Schistosoma mansoni]